MTCTLDIAIRCAARGWPAFPCKPGGKQPMTAHGLLDATTDAAELRRLWRTNANVAVRTGRESGLVVLDVDGDDGFESLRVLEREHGRLPTTLTVKTPRGGGHFYFAHPGREVRNSAGQLGVGLDVRGDGGYVLVPPSRLVDGRAYEVDEQAPPAPLPEWLGALIVAAPVGESQPTPVVEWLAIVQGVNQGQRNAQLTRLVGHLLARDVDVRLTLQFAHLVNQRCRPPLDGVKVDRIVESIAGREIAKRQGARR